MLQITSKSGRVFNLPSDEDDARIRAGIAADPDTHEVSDAEFALMRRPGRPLGSGTKTQITLRIDTAIVDKYKATGPGWQTRINDVLRAHA
jgi:uncharacterized protein (DUF4415 family)